MGGQVEKLFLGPEILKNGQGASDGGGIPMSFQALKAACGSARIRGALSISPVPSG